ncbi:MAG: SDR family NAD(P)-dependent oxidoreductase [Dehalococcoidia bacterium]|nr:SDR family NAD(P)-dependent oxidoreductase [Dehalococcoidia bacterium]
MKELKGKVAVVTGGASGIGRAMAERFASAGMKVVLADVEQQALDRAESEMKAKGATVASKRTDVSRGDDVEALAKFTVETFGGVHVLCNNAGVGVGGVIWQQTVKDWEWVLGVNLWGVIHGVRVFVPIMIAQGEECHVVNTASGAGLHTRPWLGMYCASKHAVVALSETLYQELSLTGSKVKVSVLCPAVVNTRIGESQRNRPAPLRNDDDSGAAVQQMQAMEQAFRATLAKGLPPEQVADAVLTAIQDETFYVITHEETKERVRARMEDILEGRSPTAHLVEP